MKGMGFVCLCKNLLMFLCFTMLAAPAAMAASGQAAVLPAGAAAYAPILKNLQHILANGLEGRERGDGEHGVMEAMTGQEGPEALRSVGWLVRDLSGDGIPELLVGAVSQDADGKSRGGDIYALYTLKDGKPHLTQEGTLRNAFSLMGNGRFFQTGSGGGMRRIFAIVSLTPDATALTCRDFWFTHEKASPEWGMGFFHNTTGEMDISRSQEVDEALFTARTDAMQQECQIAEFTPFSQAIADEETSSLAVPAGQHSASSVTARFGFGNILMGGWSPQQGWLNAQQLQNDARFHDFRIWGGEVCRVFGMHGLVEDNAIITAIHNEHGDESPAARADVPSFEVHTATGGISAPSGFLTVLCDWNIQPRSPVLLQTGNTTYQGIIKNYLAAKGLRTDRIQLVQLCKIDLEGDGVDEVLIYAQNLLKHDTGWAADKAFDVDSTFPSRAFKGAYSVLLLRKVAGGKVVQLPLHEYIHAQTAASGTANPLPVLAKLYQFADLNGDGTLEIITGTASHTNRTHHVFEVKGHKVREVLSSSTKL
ncbi:MAG: hypothetical protein IJA79_02965 [Desulfovibrio sp.]|nr:hypothetical protein [Desulfovibrio sp.]